MNLPLVSIIIPVFNGSNYMREAIDSALGQTYSAVEVIVVNDGSKDGGKTADIARSYGDRVRYIEKQNGGVASALNAGIRAMRGDVFCWLSHDDRHHPDKTTRQVEEWVSHGSKDEVLISNYRLIDAQGAKISDIVLNHELLTAKPLYTLLRGSIHGCTVFIPKKILDDLGGFDESLPTTQDVALWQKLIKKYPFRHLPMILIDSRWHDEQGSKQGDHKIEARDFWVNLVEDVDVREKVKLEGSRTLFDVRTADFLAENGLHEAANIIRDRAYKNLKDIKISVVIPVYNRLALAMGAIESVRKQTHENWEVIVVDDGSTEDMTILENYLEHMGPKARFFRKENGGPGSARNFGWLKALGEYIAFLDSDDLFMPRKLELQLRAMEEGAHSFSHTSYFRYVQGSNAIKLHPTGPYNTFPSIIGGCSIATPTVMIRTSIHSEEAQFRTDIHLGEDICLWIELGSRHGSLPITEGLSVVRTNADSAAYDSIKEKTGVDNILRFVKANPRFNGYEQLIEALTNYRTLLDAR